MTPKDNTSAPQIDVSGSGNTLVFPLNISNTAMTHTETVIQNNWYQREMSKHKLWYWIFHGLIAFVVALAATALWELWLNHVFR